ncbi:MAG: response regulator [Deltaproteobacteria bacterium]|nr:response regulator [Deltaproteobacteria bacterium]
MGDPKTMANASPLADFRQMEFFAQVSLLGEIQSGAVDDCFEDLVDLFVNPVGDKSVDNLVHATLASLLERDDSSVVRGMGSPYQELASLCAHIAGKKRFSSAVQTMIRVLANDPPESLVFDFLSALTQLIDPSALPLFRRYAEDTEPMVASVAIRGLGRLRDEESLPLLSRIVELAGSDTAYHHCEIHSWEAVQTLATISSPAALDILADHIHHRNPTLRRGIIEALTAAGDAAVPPLARIVSTGSPDPTIMAANVLGLIGSRKGTRPLLQALDACSALDPNVRFSIFEALGRIGDLQSLVALFDALLDQDEFTVRAASQGLEANASPSLADRLAAAMAASTDKGQGIAQALARTGASEILGFLRQKPPLRSVVEEAEKSTFPKPQSSQARPLRLLAVDDSKTMRVHYRQILEQVGHQVETAENGSQALDAINSEKTFDLLITDLNMPMMTGMELLSRLRSMGVDTPAILVTTESDESQISLAMDTGFSAVLSKPFKTESLLDLLASLV